MKHLSHNTIPCEQEPMNKTALFVGWGALIPGREKIASQVLNEAKQYLLKLQQEGTIDSFELVILEPHGGELAGFVLAKGDKETIHRLRTSDEFIRVISRVQLVHSHVGVVGAYTGAEIHTLVQISNQQIAELLGTVTDK